MTFIKRVARFIKRRDLVGLAGKVIAVFGVYFGMSIALIVVTLRVGLVNVREFRQSTMELVLTVGCFGVVIMILGIVAVCMYAALLTNMAKAIDKQMREAASQNH